MWLVVILITFLSLNDNGCCEYIPEIQISLKRNFDNDVTCGVVSPKLTLWKRFTIKLLNDELIIGKSSKCYANENSSISTEITQNEEGYYVAKKPKKTTKHKKWTCALYVKCKKKHLELCNYYKNDKYYYSNINCTFTQNIRDPDLGYMTINGFTQTLLPSDQNEYDFIGNYSYFAGQETTVSCEINYDKNAPVPNAGIIDMKTTYPKANRTISTGVQVGPYVKKYMKLTADYNGGYIDCHMSDFSNDTSLVIRVVLQMIPNPELAFQVNGLTLSPIIKGNNRSYIYKYFDGEELTIGSIKDDSMYGDMKCNGNMINNSSIGNSSQNQNTHFKGLHIGTNQTDFLKNMSLDCLVKIRSTGQVEHHSLHLVPVTFDYQPYIKGLSNSHILDKFQNNSLNLIRYEYDDKLDLYLRCYSYPSVATWSYNQSQVANVSTPEIKTETNTNGYFLVYGVFKLAGVENANISCITNIADTTKVTTVELVRTIEKQVVDDNFVNPGSEITTETPNTNNNAIGDDGNEETGFFSKKIVKIGFGTGTVLLVIFGILAWTLICLTRRKRQITQNPDETNITYNNLPEHHAGQVPTPQLWSNQEAQYATPSDRVKENNDYMQPFVPTLKDLYAKIIPKSQRIDNMNHYEEPAYAIVGNVESNNSQAVPGNMNHGPNFVQIFENSTDPVTKIKKSNAKEVLNENPYAEIVQKETPYAKMVVNAQATENPYDSPYATIAPESESPYAEPTFDSPAREYANVFDNQRYVNSNAKEDNVEPAYCEVKK